MIAETTGQTTALAAEIGREIRLEGPMTMARYMDLCLAHPEHGYYRTRDPLGRGGDFITAPEISQMFGEMLGLWAAQVWLDMGRPRRISLVELGPGRGTLMADALRAVRVVPGFLDAADIHLVETSPPLRDAQSQSLKDHRSRLHWHDRTAALPETPLIVLANEFFDALPIRQFQWTGQGWHERLVGLDDAGALAFGLSPQPVARAALPMLPDNPDDGDIVESCPFAVDIFSGLCRRLQDHGGAALVVDYGYAGPATGDTLQAVAAHRFAPVLDNPGDADLTAHVDFSALASAARAAGTTPWGPVSQGDFLIALGIRERAAALRARARAQQASAIDSALERLTSTDGMGDLFRVLAATPDQAPPPPPFQQGNAP